MEKFVELARVYKKYLQEVRPECIHLYEFTLAQWALESGWGSSKLAKEFNNFGGMKYRKEIAADFPDKQLYRDWSGEQVFYFKLSDIEDWPHLYFAFINRSIYHGWREHKDCGKCFMKHLAKRGYCGSMPGVDAKDVPYEYARKIELITKSKDFQRVLALV